MSKDFNNNFDKNKAPSLWTNPISPDILALGLPALEQCTYMVLKIFCPRNSGVFRVSNAVLAGHIAVFQLDEDLQPKPSEVKQAVANLHAAGLITYCGNNVFWLRDRWEETNNPNHKGHVATAIRQVANFPEVIKPFCDRYNLRQDWVNEYLPDSIEVSVANKGQLVIEDALNPAPAPEEELSKPVPPPKQAGSNPHKNKIKIKKKTKTEKSSSDDELSPKKTRSKKSPAQRQTDDIILDNLAAEQIEIMKRFPSLCNEGLTTYSKGYWEMAGTKHPSPNQWRKFFDNLLAILTMAKVHGLTDAALNHGLQAAGFCPSKALNYIKTSAVKFDLEAKAKEEKKEPDTPDAATLAAIRGNNN